MKTNPLQRTGVLYFFIGMLFFIYVLIRAIKVGITFDEGTTLGIFVPQSYLSIYSYFSVMANNHWLNTFSIKLLYTLTGKETIFIARVPNLIAMLFFLFYLYRVCSTYLKKHLGYLLFLIILLNPFLLDFFGLARGYGIAQTFMIAGLFYLIRFGQHEKERDGIFALCMAVLSSLSNFTYLLFLGAAYVVAQSITFSGKSKFRVRVFLKFNLIIAVTFGIIIFPLKKLHDKGALWYGGERGFFEDTLYTLVDSSLGFRSDPELVIIVLKIVLILFFCACILSILFGKEEKHSFRKPSLILFFTLGVCIISNILSHQLLDAKFFIHRTALIYFPLFMSTLVFLINDNLEKYSSIIMQITLFGILVGATINFQQHYNYYATISWFYDAPVTKVLDYINEKGKTENRIFILDSTIIFRGSLQYYHWKRKYKNIVYLKDQPDNLDESFADYFLYMEIPLEDCNYNPSNELVRMYQRPIVLHFEKEGVLLLSNRGRGKQ